MSPLTLPVYFQEAGDHTQEVVEVVKQKLNNSDITEVVVATTSGKTALVVAEKLKSAKIIAVTHQAGFRERGKLEIEPHIITSLKEKDVSVLTATHALAGIGRAVRKMLGTWETSEIVAQTLRIFGQGTKVCAEIVLMAADAGLLSMSDVIAIGGTNSGADTAWVISPAHTHSFFDLKMKELICKPLNF